MNEAIDRIDQWAEAVVQRATGCPVRWLDGSMLIQLPELSNPDDVRRREMRINEELAPARFTLRKPFNVNLPEELADASEVCQDWQDWGQYLPNYFPDDGEEWRLTIKDIKPGAVLQGYDPMRVSFNLIQDSGGEIPVLERRAGGAWETWMSVTDMEVGTMSDQVLEARGDVLVGGLGLALFPALLEMNENVRSITIVEMDGHVIEMMEPYTDLIGATVVHDDLELYAATRTAEESFDYIYVDIWQSIIESYENEPQIRDCMEPLLRPGGKTAVWCQRFNRRRRRLERLLLSMDRGRIPPFTMQPCFICGNAPRVDYFGSCANCADRVLLNAAFKVA